MLKFLKFFKGILLKQESSTITYDASTEGAIYNNQNQGLRSHIEGADREVVTDTQTQTLTNKTIDADNNTITNIGDAELEAGIDAAKIADGSVSNTEFQHINSLTSNAQTQIDSKQDDVITTEGDLVIGNASNQESRLPIGSNGQVLKSDGTTASWQNESAGLTDPMTTRGDVIYRDATNTTNRLGVGTNGQVLKSDGTDVSWADEDGLADPMTTRGDIIYRNSSNTTTRLPVGTAGQVLTSDGTDTSWSDPVGTSATKDVNQTGHGFAVGDVIKSNGTNNEYEKAQADSGANAQSVGIVTTVDDANNFTYTPSGPIITLSGLTAGDVYYLDDTTAGDVTTTAPDDAFPIYTAINATEAVLHSYQLSGEASGGGPVGGARALIMGGLDYSSTVADTFIGGLDAVSYIPMDGATGNSTDFGDLTIAKSNGFGSGDATTALYGGGTERPVVVTTDDVETATFATTGNFTNVGTLTVVKSSPSGAGNASRTLSYGYDSGNVIDYASWGSLGTWTDFGDTLASFGPASNGGNSTTRAIFSGNAGSTSNVIQYVEIDTTSNATDFGDLLVAVQRNNGGSSATRYIACGGIGDRDAMEEVTIATLGNSTNWGSLTVQEVSQGGAASSKTNIYLFGGKTDASVRVDTIQYLVVETGTSTTDFGDITGPTDGVESAVGCSNDHGGL